MFDLRCSDDMWRIYQKLRNNSPGIIVGSTIGFLAAADLAESGLDIFGEAPPLPTKSILNCYVIIYYVIVSWVTYLLTNLMISLKINIILFHLGYDFCWWSNISWSWLIHNFSTISKKKWIFEIFDRPQFDLGCISMCEVFSLKLWILELPNVLSRAYWFILCFWVGLRVCGFN